MDTSTHKELAPNPVEARRISYRVGQPSKVQREVWRLQAKTEEASIIKAFTTKDASLASEDVKKKARHILETSTVKAASKLRRGISNQWGPNKDLLTSADKRIMLECAKDILDRCGLKSADVQEIHNERNYTPEELNSIKNTLLEIEGILTRLGPNNSKFVLRAASNAISKQEAAAALAHLPPEGQSPEPPIKPSSP